MSRTEGIVHVDVGIRCQRLGELLLALLHLLLGSVVGGVSLVDAHGLALLFGVEAQVFKQEHLARLQGGSGLLSLGAIGGKLHLHAKLFAHGVYNLAQRHLGVHLALGLAHVAHDDECATLGQHLLQRRQCTANAGVVGNFTVFIKRHIEVHADDHFLAFEIASFDSHN